MQERPVRIRRIGIYGAESLARPDFFSLAYRCRGKAGIDGKVFAMAEHDNGVESVLTEYCGHGPLKHRTRRCAPRHFYIYSGIVNSHMPLGGMGLTPELAHYLVTAAHREKKTPFVGCKRA